MIKLNHRRFMTSAAAGAGSVAAMSAFGGSAFGQYKVRIRQGCWVTRSVTADAFDAHYFNAASERIPLFDQEAAAE